MKSWAKSWWITFRYGSVFTREGRALRYALKNWSEEDWLEAERPE